MRVLKNLCQAIILLSLLTSCGNKSDSSLSDIENSNKDEYEKLSKYLEERKLELCSFNTLLGDMELDCIQKANEKYPEGGGVKHLEYSKELMRVERKKLAKKYNLDDSIFINVPDFAMEFCKN